MVDPVSAAPFGNPQGGIPHMLGEVGGLNLPDLLRGAEISLKTPFAGLMNQR